MKRLMVAVVVMAAAAFAGCSGDNDNCKDACAALAGCNLQSGGLNCSDDCGDDDNQKACAECVNRVAEEACNSVPVDCAPVCGGRPF
jgi:hypothetical protein